MKNIIFIAPPAAGKGTQSEMLKEKYGYIHISTGDMLREATNSGTEFGEMVKNIISAGNLVSDDIMIRLIREKLEEIGKPFILDGFPRTLAQAEALSLLLEEKNTDYQAVYLELDEETATKRVLGRLTCECGKSYNELIDELKPKNGNVCDSCGKELIKRADDNEESFKKRYEVFIENTKPILDFYQNKNKVSIINASQNVNDIFDAITEVINIEE